MEEKRRHVRLGIPLKAKYRILNLKTPWVNTLIRDISAGGLSIFLQGVINNKDELSLEIAFPDDLGSLYAQGQVTWINANVKKLFAGLIFTRLSSFDRSRIISFINLEKQKEKALILEKTSEIIFFKETEAKDKQEIMELLLSNAEKLENGLKFIDKNIDLADLGVLDILGIDLQNGLVLVELLTDEDEHILVIALKHFEWVLRHVQILKKIYSLEINLSKSPRLMIIAPHFSESFKRLIENIKPVKIELYEYNCIESQESKGVFLKKVAKKQHEPILLKRLVSEKEIESFPNLDILPFSDL